MAAKYFLARNGRAASSHALSAKELLISSPRGAYTTARTVGRCRIFDLDRHLERLSETSILMTDESLGSLRDILASARLLRPHVLPCARAALVGFSQLYPELDESERKLTILVTWSRAELDVYAHVAALPPRPVPPVEVHVLGAPRSNAKAKDSEWVRDRQVLEASKPSHVNELLLCDGVGELPEGTQTNFFVVAEGGVVLTAPDDGSILAGTVRGLILDVCSKANIPFKFCTPNVRDIGSWDEAFLASTSRLVLPIDRMRVVEAAGLENVQRNFDGHPVGDRLLELVQNELMDRSSDIFSDAGGGL